MSVLFLFIENTSTSTHTFSKSVALTNPCEVIHRGSNRHQRSAFDVCKNGVLATDQHEVYRGVQTAIHRGDARGCSLANE